MSEYRFYLGDNQDFREGSEVELDAAAAHRIAHVLRLRAGQPISVFGCGREFRALLLADSPCVRVRLLEELPPLDCAAPHLTLYQGLIRPNRFEWLIEKGTELGVTGFVPVLTERTAVRAVEIGPARLERWRRIGIEATEQSGGRRPPSIATPVSFDRALALAGPALILAWEGSRTPPAPAERVRLRDAASDLSLLIGPEGGFSESEVARARYAGAVLIGLGPRTLRAETAAIVAAALLLLG